MTVSRLIKTERDYAAALDRIDKLMDADPGSVDFEELELLSALAELYEREHYPIPPADPLDAIKFRIEQAGLKPKDLVPILGSRSKVSEVLSGKRPLTLSMIRALNERLGIPAEILLREPGATLPNKAVPNPEKLPWKEIVERNWLAPFFRGSVAEARAKAEELSQYLFRNLRQDDLQIAFYRQNVRAARIDPYALLAWTARIVNVAREILPPVPYRKGSVDDEFMDNLISFSFLDEGPRLAREFLLKNGVVLVIELHLQKTHVDGAATKLPDGTPVIGLSLRHNRLDNFWFCLCHELAHLTLHLDQKEDCDWYVDDLDIADNSRQEREADAWAQNKLIPPAHWMRIKACQTVPEVERAAQELRISPSILAGRIRFERKNYKLLSRLVGQGEVHRQLLS